MPGDAVVKIADLLEQPEQAALRVLGIQRKLHGWAVKDRRCRFDDLFNLVTDPAFLVVAWARVRGNTGARSPGVDQRTVRSIISGEGAAGFLGDLRGSIRDGSFRPLPVKERLIPKPGSASTRRLGIPTVADRVVQASLKLVLEPILESDFYPSSYGFRPRRRAQDAIEDIRKRAAEGYEWILEADITACFDEIDHSSLLGRLRDRIGDRRVISLVKAFLHAGIMTELGRFEETMTGTPQGGILSPLLANLALSHLDQYYQESWDAHGNRGRRMRYRRQGGATYRLVRYADDFVVMVFGSRSHVEEQWYEVSDVLGRIGLRLAPSKTRIVHIDEGFDFLGFHIQRHTQKGSGRRYIYTYPSKKSMHSIRRKVKLLTKRITYQEADVLMLRLNSMARGWAQYFRHASSSTAYHHLQRYMWWRFWYWLHKQHPRTSGRKLIHRYYNGWWPEYNGTELYKPTTMTIQRYRYRGGAIPTPWDQPTPISARLVESRMR